jgi:hypothetical protein
MMMSYVHEQFPIDRNLLKAEMKIICPSKPEWVNIVWDLLSLWNGCEVTLKLLGN